MDLRGLIGKKGLIAAVLLFWSFGAQAQRVYIGGNIGLTGNADGDGISLLIAPDISYAVSNTFIVGGQLSYRTGYDMFALTPYARWHIMPLGKGLLSIYVSASLPCEFAGSNASVGLYVRPGLALRIVGRTYFTASFGYAGYCWDFAMGHLTGSGWTARLDSDCIDFGITVCL